MKKPRHFSHSGFKLFEKDPEAYYRYYLAEKALEREPQNHYMAIGSAFDAFVKVDLHKIFINDGDPGFTLPYLFEKQVDEQWREQAWVDGQKVYGEYKSSGAFDDLCEEMKGCVSPGFETDISGVVCAEGHDGGVLINGKPDVQYFNSSGKRIIHDFKVNGFYSKSPPSPKEGYLKIFQTKFGTRMPVGKHKKAVERVHKGHKINGAAFFSSNCEEWADQLSMYAWVLGEPVGSDYVLSVDQMVCNSQKGEIRIAKHAGLCSERHQRQLYARLHRAWTAVNNGHVFLNMPYEQSMAKCKTIDLEMAHEMDATQKMMTEAPKRIR